MSRRGLKARELERENARLRKEKHDETKRADTAENRLGVLEKQFVDMADRACALEVELKAIRCDEKTSQDADAVNGLRQRLAAAEERADAAESEKRSWREVAADMQRRLEECHGVDLARDRQAMEAAGAAKRAIRCDAVSPPGHLSPACALERGHDGSHETVTGSRWDNAPTASA